MAEAGSTVAALDARPSALSESERLTWRPRLTPEALKRKERRWALWHLFTRWPFFITAAVLMVIEPLLAPAALWSVSHGVWIPMVYARRGIRSVVPLSGIESAAPDGDPDAERVALGLLGDLLGHEARELAARTGLAMQQGQLGVWLLGERGAFLIRPGGKRVDCWCVVIADVEGLPAADRVSHLLLALREDELGFATVANMDFSGAVGRVRHRIESRSRPAFDRAIELASGM